jgi:hypothetical protein
MPGKADMVDHSVMNRPEVKAFLDRAQGGLVAFAKRSLAEGRSTIDLIEDLQMRGMTAREAESLVGELDPTSDESP